MLTVLGFIFSIFLFFIAFLFFICGCCVVTDRLFSKYHKNPNEELKKKKSMYKEILEEIEKSNVQI